MSCSSSSGSCGHCQVHRLTVNDELHVNGGAQVTTCSSTDSALVVSNQSQEAGDLVHIQGTSERTALHVENGDVMLTDTRVMSDTNLTLDSSQQIDIGSAPGMSVNYETSPINVGTGGQRSIFVGSDTADLVQVRGVTVRMEGTTLQYRGSQSAEIDSESGGVVCIGCDESADQMVELGSSVTPTVVNGRLEVVGGVQSTAMEVTGGSAVPDGASVVLITSSAGSDVVTLPSPVAGNIVHLMESTANGYTLQSSDVASVQINGVLGASVAVAGTTAYVQCVCVSSTSWICRKVAEDGTASPV